jgi:hypothetical protein
MILPSVIQISKILQNSQDLGQTLYKDYILNGTAPLDQKNEKALRTRILRFTIIQGTLYKKSMAGPYLRCLEDYETREVLKDIHEGDCGNHTGGRSLCSKIQRTGCSWPFMKWGHGYSGKASQSSWRKSLHVG